MHPGGREAFTASCSLIGSGIESNLMKKTLVMGLGNPILGDDGVGWKVAEGVLAQLQASPNSPGGIDVETASLGGLSLMERMLGYQQVVLIDALQTDRSPAGAVSVFPLSDLPDPAAGHSASAHDTSLMAALKLARSLQAGVPDRIDVVAIEASQVYEFSEQLSPAVAQAVPEAIRRVMELLSIRDIT